MKTVVYLFIKLHIDIIIFCCLILCVSSSFNAEGKVPPQEWQIKGALAALDDNNPDVQAEALKKLDEIGILKQIPKSQIPQIINFLENKNWNINWDLHSDNAEELNNLANRIKKSIPQIAGFLNHENPEVRAATIKSLNKLNTIAIESIPKIQIFLEHKDANVRRITVQALGQLGKVIKASYPSNFGNLVVSADNDMRESALEAMEELKNVAKIYLPQIVVRLKDSDPTVRFAALEALGRLGKDDLVKPYITEIAKCLTDFDPIVRSTAIEVLNNLHEITTYTSNIENCLKDTDFIVRKAAVEALGNLGEKGRIFVPQIIAGLQDDNPSVRFTAAITLGKIDKIEEDAIQQIVLLLKHENPYVRIAAIWAIGNLREVAEKYLDIIGDLLKDKNEESRVYIAVISVLGNMGKVTEKYVPEIGEYLQDKDPNVVTAAIEALEKLDAKKYVQQIETLLASKNPNVCLAAMDALINFREVSKETILKILECLEHEDLSVRCSAVEVLGYLGRETAEEYQYIPRIVALLEHKDSSMRIAAIKALSIQSEATRRYIPQLIILLDHKDSDVRVAAVEVLGTLSPLKEEYILKIAALLNDKNSDVRVAAVRSLGKLGEQAKTYLPQIIALLKFKEATVRIAVLEALSNLGELDLQLIPHILNPIYDNDISLAVELRFFAHFVGAGKQDVEFLLKWLGKPENNYPIAEKLSTEEASKTLHVFNSVWESSKPFPAVCLDLAKQIAVIISQRKSKWNLNDLPLIREQLQHLESEQSPYADAIKNVIATVETREKVFQIVIIIILIGLSHIAFWFILILKYPEYPRIQRIFWNPKVRKIIGVGYIGWILVWIPCLRQRLFKPFQKLLLTYAWLDEWEKMQYFEHSKVEIKKTPKIPHIPIKEGIPQIRGTIILEGESGLGKTMFARYLLKYSNRVAAYIPAEKCSKGIIKAIQSLLSNVNTDPDFLEKLIYKGAIDLCIDGLNEVNENTRQDIIKFVESSFYGNILITTQPIIEWTIPNAIKTYVLQPLEEKQVEELLARLRGTGSEQACKDYLANVLKDRDQTLLDSGKYILANPMNLTILADVLEYDDNPDIFHLQKRQYQIMAEEYEEKHNAEFPFKRLSERVYEMRLNDNTKLPSNEFTEEFEDMERHKMLVSREHNNSLKEWHFRHEKIMEFFLAQAFLNNEDRIRKYRDDPRFRGTYAQLAVLLPFDTAINLREDLIQHAVDINDHTISDLFIKSLRAREKVSPEILSIKEFLEKTGAKISPWNKGLRVDKARDKLEPFTPFPVIVVVKTLKKGDIDWLVQQSKQMSNGKERIGVLFYYEISDAALREYIIELRISKHFILIPVPLAAAEAALSNSRECKGLIDEYIDRYIQIPVLFDERISIKDGFGFFGRNELLNRVERDLLKRESIGLFGLRKAGKTSILHQLKNIFRQYPVIHIDLQGYGGDHYGVKLFNRILKDIYALIPNYDPQSIPLFSENIPAADLSDKFARMLCELVEQLPYKLPLICMIDELDCVFPTPQDSNTKVKEFNAVFGTFRMLSQERGILALLVIDVHPDCNQINRWKQEGVSSNPIYHFFKEVFLPPFSIEETYMMIATIGKFIGREFDEKTLKTIHEESGGRPYLARQLANFLCERIPIDKAQRITWELSQPYIEKTVYSELLMNDVEQSFWGELEKRNYNTEMLVLQKIVLNRDKPIREEILIQNCDPCPKREVMRSLNRLEALGLLERQDFQNATHYQIRPRLLSRWIEKM